MADVALDRLPVSEVQPVHEVPAELTGPASSAGKIGRPKIYKDNAARQAAYRVRKSEGLLS